MVNGIANNNRQLLIEQSVIGQQSAAPKKIVDKVKIAPQEIDQLDQSKPVLLPNAKHQAVLPDTLSAGSKVSLGAFASANKTYDVAVMKDAEYVAGDQDGIVAGNPVTVGVDAADGISSESDQIMAVDAGSIENDASLPLATVVEDFSKLDEYKQLAFPQQNLCLNALAASSDKQALSKSLSKLLKNKDFTAADNSTKEAVLAQCVNFPVALAADKLTEMVKIGWFKDMDLADQQRAAKSIAYMSETAAQAPAGSDQKKILTNTMERLLNGSIPLAFVPMDDDPGYITFGYAINGEAGIYINIDLVPAGNDPFPKDDDYARQAILDTIPHEVSHQVNKDVNEATYKYFQAEYRAWYIGWVANNGTVPTNQDAYDRAIELLSIYDSLNEAYFEGGTHTTKILNFISQIVGVKLKIASSSEDELVEVLSVELKKPNAAAPVPDSSLKPDMDN